MFDVRCHLIQHSAFDLSGPWCDSGPCKNECTGIALRVFQRHRVERFFLVPLSFLDLMLRFLMNVAKVLDSLFISMAKT